MSVADHNSQSTPRHRLTFFTKETCPLCDGAWFVVQKLAARYEIDLQRVDITDDGNTHLFSLYCHDIPVVHLDGAEILRHRVSERKLREQLDALGVPKRPTPA